MLTEVITLIALYTVRLCISLLSYWIYSDITNANYLLILAVFPSIEFILDISVRKVCGNIDKILIMNSYTYYEKLTFESKNKLPFKEFKQKNYRANQAIINFVNTGTARVTDIISGISILVLTQPAHILLSAVVGYFILYKLLISKQHKKMSDTSSKLRNARKVQNSKHLIYDYMFQHNQIGYTSLSDIDNSMIDINTEYDTVNGFSQIYTKMFNNAVILLAVYTSSSVINQMTFMVKLTATFASLMSFISFYKSNVNDYYDYYDSIKDLKSDDKECLHLDLPETFTASTDTCDIVIKKGDKILITGESASGKTTFINKLLGKLEGVKYSTGIHPKSYFNNFVEVYQTIKETVPNSGITIRQLFFDCTDDDKILKCLQICEFTYYTNAIGLDTDISKRPMSGGEKTRLCIAFQLYRLFNNNAKVLIIDEPEQGLDTASTERLISNLLTINSTLMIISHSPAKDKFKWDTTIKVHKGAVSV